MGACRPEGGDPRIYRGLTHRHNLRERRAAMVHYELCHRCELVGEINEMTAVHLEYKGQTRQFFFHNRNAEDCLAKEIRDLKRRFENADRVQRALAIRNQSPNQAT